MLCVVVRRPPRDGHMRTLSGSKPPDLRLPFPGKLWASIRQLIVLIRECGGVNWKALVSCLFFGGWVNKTELMTWRGAGTLQVSGKSGDVKEMLLLR